MWRSVLFGCGGGKTSREGEEDVGEGMRRGRCGKEGVGCGGANKQKGESFSSKFENNPSMGPRRIEDRVVGKRTNREARDPPTRARKGA